jgi:hypothetical protein
METPNAFIGKKARPSDKDVASKLGAAADAWKELIGWLKGQGIACDQWKSISPKYGWTLYPALRRRTILYMGPCEGCFRAAFVLGDRAVAAARSSDLPASVVEQIASARRFAEGTGVRLIVRTPDDLDVVRKLVGIKLQN